MSLIHQVSLPTFILTCLTFLYLPFFHFLSPPECKGPQSISIIEKAHEVLLLWIALSFRLRWLRAQGNGFKPWDDTGEDKIAKMGHGLVFYQIRKTRIRSELFCSSTVIMLVLAKWFIRCSYASCCLTDLLPPSTCSFGFPFLNIEFYTFLTKHRVP